MQLSKMNPEQLFFFGSLFILFLIFILLKRVSGKSEKISSKSSKETELYSFFKPISLVEIFEIIGSVLSIIIFFFIFTIGVSIIDYFNLQDTTLLSIIILSSFGLGLAGIVFSGTILLRESRKMRKRELEAKETIKDTLFYPEEVKKVIFLLIVLAVILFFLNFSVTK